MLATKLARDAAPVGFLTLDVLPAVRAIMRASSLCYRRDVHLCARSGNCRVMTRATSKTQGGSKTKVVCKGWALGRCWKD